MMKTLHGGWCLAGTMTWTKLGLLILSKLVRPALRTRYRTPTFTDLFYLAE